MENRLHTKLLTLAPHNSVMILIDWSKGFVLVRFVVNDIAITSDMIAKNRGWENLKMLPVRCAWVGRYNFPENLSDILADEFAFQHFLQEEFHHLSDGVYALWVWRDSLRWIKKGERRYQKVRPWAAFAKFEVQGGSILFNQDYKKNARGKTYKVWLIFTGEEEMGTALLPRTRRITLRDLGM